MLAKGITYLVVLGFGRRVLINLEAASLPLLIPEIFGPKQNFVSWRLNHLVLL